MRGEQILIADDDRIARENLEYILKRDGYRVTAVDSGDAAIQEIVRSEPDLVMTDLKMQPVDGATVLKKTRERYPDTEVIVITGYATVNSAVQAMQNGAFSYIPKPYQIDEVRVQVRQALEKRALKQEVHELRQQVKRHREPPLLIGNSREIETLKQTISQIAATDCSVLILGETGVGKELVAKTVHYQSLRAEKRFLAVNCGAFSEDLLSNELFGHERDAFTGARGLKKGLFEAASGGTVFLDEIGDMPLSMQIKLLRVLQEKALIRVGGTDEIPIDIRVIAATNKNLMQEVEHGVFRQDLYYRLNVISLPVPRLADRKDDILLLALHFMRQFAKAQAKQIQAIDDEVIELLLSYEFPGNVRELENFMERAVALCTDEIISLANLPEDLRRLAGKIRHNRRFMTLEENEREYIEWILKQVDENKTRAAEILGIDRVSLWRKLKRYNLE
ncbi:MAG: sigma-54 dependent transcriptional regulator [Desulfatirhabdiaceae bacterium]